MTDPDRPESRWQQEAFRRGTVWFVVLAVAVVLGVLIASADLL